MVRKSEKGATIKALNSHWQIRVVAGRSRVRSRPNQIPRRNPLVNRRSPKERKRDIVFEPRNRVGPLGKVAVDLERLLGRGDTLDLVARCVDVAAVTPLFVEGLHEIAEVRKRVADGGSFPIQYGNDAVLGRVEPKKRSK